MVVRRFRQEGLDGGGDTNVSRLFKFWPFVSCLLIIINGVATSLISVPKAN